MDRSDVFRNTVRKNREPRVRERPASPDSERKHRNRQTPERLLLDLHAPHLALGLVEVGAADDQQVVAVDQIDRARRQTRGLGRIRAGVARRDRRVLELADVLAQQAKNSPLDEVIADVEVVLGIQVRDAHGYTYRPVSRARRIGPAVRQRPFLASSQSGTAMSRRIRGDRRSVTRAAPAMSPLPRASASLRTRR